MFRNNMSYVLASDFSLIYDICKIFPFAITEQCLQLACTPAFHTIYFKGSLLKSAI